LLNPDHDPFYVSSQIIFILAGDFVDQRLVVAFTGLFEYHLQRRGKRGRKRWMELACLFECSYFVWTDTRNATWEHAHPFPPSLPPFFPPSPPA